MHSRNTGEFSRITATCIRNVLYRYLKHQMRRMNFLDGAFDLGNVCPACPQVGYCCWLICDPLGKLGITR